MRFRSPVIYPLHRSDYKGRYGTRDFFVTQHFYDLDYYWSRADPAKANKRHEATDLGNRHCGDPIVAMAPGKARILQDNATAFGARTNALGVEVNHGEGVTTEYWHLASWSVSNGQQVNAGQEIGKLGATGLGAVCHVHVEAKINGDRIDAEPLMFGGSIGEDDNLLPLIGLVSGKVPKGTNLRSGPSVGTDATKADIDSWVDILGLVVGKEWRVGPQSGKTWWSIQLHGNEYYVAEPLLHEIQLTGQGKRRIPVNGANERAVWLDWLETHPK